LYWEESRYNNPNSLKPVLPGGFEFLPVKRSIVIKKEKDNKEQYMDLLLEADPSKDMINDYLRDGELFLRILIKSIDLELTLSDIYNIPKI